MFTRPTGATGLRTFERIAPRTPYRLLHFVLNRCFFASAAFSFHLSAPYIVGYGFVNRNALRTRKGNLSQD